MASGVGSGAAGTGTVARWEPSAVCVAQEGALGASPKPESGGGRWCTSMMGPVHSVTARSMTLRSSRTLPGQPCVSRIAMAGSVTASSGRPASRHASVMNARASGWISLLRWRSGGMTRLMPFRRK